MNQNENSQIFQFFKLQLEHPTKCDWVSKCLNDLSELRILETLDKIKQMSRNEFKNLIKRRIEINAFEYLHNKRGSKGEEKLCKATHTATAHVEVGVQLNAKRQKIAEGKGKWGEELVVGKKIGGGEV